MLTEVEAWETLLKGFSNPVECPAGLGSGACYILIAGRRTPCICPAIDCLLWCGDITEMTREFMKKKVERYGPAHQTTESWRCVFWPLNPEGAAQRVEFIKTILKEFTDVDSGSGSVVTRTGNDNLGASHRNPGK